MKILIVSTFLLANLARAQGDSNCAAVSACPEAFMPKPIVPTSNAKQAVQSAIEAAQRAESNADELAIKLQKIENAIGANLRNDYKWLPSWAVDKLVTPEKIRRAAISDPTYIAEQDKLRMANWENYKAHNNAIVLAAQTYRLFPPVTDFAGDPRAAGVNMVAKSWLPQYSRQEVRDRETGEWRRRTEAELQVEMRREGSINAAATRGNGEMKVFGQAFTKADDLAVLIYHETSHWIDVVGKSGGFTQSDLPEVSFRTEEHAYGRAAAFASQLGMESEWHSKRSARFKTQADEAHRENLKWDQVAVRHPNWIGTDRRGLLAAVPADSEVTAGDESLLRQKMAEAQAAVRASQEEEARIKREEEQRRAIFSQPIVPRQDPPESYASIPPTQYMPGGEHAAAIPRQMDPIPPAIQLIARKACLTPPQPFDSYLTAISWSSFKKDFDYPSQEAGMSACELRVYRLLVNFGRNWTKGSVMTASTVTAEALSGSFVPGGGSRGGVIPPKQDHGEVRRRIGW